MGLIEKLNDLLGGKGMKVVEDNKTETPTPTPEENPTTETPVVEEVIKEIEKEAIVEAAQAEAEKIVENENKEIGELKSQLARMEEMFKKQNEMIEKQSEMLKQIPAVAPLASTPLKDDKAEMSDVDRRYEVYKNLRNN